jgi:hypothetical protein
MSKLLQKGLSQILAHTILNSMNPIIIENDWSISQDMEYAIQDNQKLFPEKVPTILNARNKSMGDLVEALSECDAVLIESTFIYKDQLEGLLNAFHAKAFGPQVFSFYVFHLRKYLNEWFEQDRVCTGMYSRNATQSFRNHARFAEQMIDLVTTEQIKLYEIGLTFRETDTRTGRLFSSAESREFMEPKATHEARRMMYNPTTKTFEYYD